MAQDLLFSNPRCGKYSGDSSVNVPATDPIINGPTGEGLAEQFGNNPEHVGPAQLRGLSVDVAEDAYIGKRRAEARNERYSEGTMYKRAHRWYGRVLAVDRACRSAFASPAVGLQTVVFDPNCIDNGEDGDKKYHDGESIGPAEQAQIVTNGVDRAIRRTRNQISGDQYIYIGVRDMDASGLSHWHVYWCFDVSYVDADSLTLTAGIESHVEGTDGAIPEDHPPTEAVKWDSAPDRTIQTCGNDQEHGGPAHPLARYVAGSLPHLGSVDDGELTSREIRHGTVEWATTSISIRRRNLDSVSVDFAHLSD